ncbi:MAG: hypothetical protein WA324_11135 [Bryobacteraceae bacterium]
MLLIFRFTALLLIALLLPSPVRPQDGTALQMRALTEAIDPNSMRVEVTDLQGKAIADAIVTFRLPEDASGGTFSDGTRIAIVNTDHSGRATVTGIRWSAAVGTASVRVTATRGTIHAGILMERQAANNREPVVTAKTLLGNVPKPLTTSTTVGPNRDSPPIPRPAMQNAASVSKPDAVTVHPTQPKPAPTLKVVAAATVKPPDQKAVVTQKPVAPLMTREASAAVPPPPMTPAPTIEPPHVSITSVSRKHLDQAQLSGSSSAAPSVVITGAGQRSRGSSKKWIILAVVAAGAAGGAAVMLSRGKSSSAATTASNSGISIGAPSISIGAP